MKEYRNEIIATYIVMTLCISLIIFALYSVFKQKYSGIKIWVTILTFIYLLTYFIKKAYTTRRKIIRVSKYKDMKEYVDKENII
jgi:hypothetical protein